MIGNKVLLSCSHFPWPVIKEKSLERSGLWKVCWGYIDKHCIVASMHWKGILQSVVIVENGLLIGIGISVSYSLAIFLLGGSCSI